MNAYVPPVTRAGFLPHRDPEFQAASLEDQIKFMVGEICFLDGYHQKKIKQRSMSEYWAANEMHKARSILKTLEDLRDGAAAP